MAIAEDLDQLETMLRQLQIEWEKFFGRVEKKPPNDLKARVEALIRRYAYAEMRNNNERFLEARQQAGEKGTVKFDSFQKLISQQASRIMADKGAQAVDFRLETKEGKVSLKAKVVKQG